MDAIDALLRRVYSGPHSDAFIVNSKGVLQTASRYHGGIMSRFDQPRRRRAGLAWSPAASPRRTDRKCSAP